MQVCKYFIWALLIAIVVGFSAALFLLSLDYVTQLRINEEWVIFALPLVGFLFGFSYLHASAGITAGNTLLFHAFEDAKVKVSWLMAPFIFFGTLITHLFGGSAGREGTAVQMGASMAIQLTRLYTCTAFERRLLLLMGISAGFAAVFGTPIAAFVFAFEFFYAKEQVSKTVFPILLASCMAHAICLACGVTHTVFPTIVLPQFSMAVLLNVMIAGLIFGFIALIFVSVNKYLSKAFSVIQFIPLRLFIAGAFMAILVWFFNAQDYIGLGISGIIHSFEKPQAYYVFALKIFFTGITLAAGFKGGEVTPLFFIGASLGSALVWIIPLPITFLAAMGLVAVFAGAANTPLAAIAMGAELFGANTLGYMALVSVLAFFSSGFDGIYNPHPALELKKNILKRVLPMNRYFH
jgi:H+/Cl- antiporter ClcA